MTNTDNRNVLAVEARRNRFAYALFECGTRLIDWGASAVSPRLANRIAKDSIRMRFSSVLRRSHPAAVVVSQPRRTRSNKSKTLGLALRTILSESDARRIPVGTMSREEVKEAFRAHGAITKEDIAWALVGHFPELLTRLPMRRGKYRSESLRMIIFDAIATGIAYLQQHGATISPPE